VYIVHAFVTALCDRTFAASQVHNWWISTVP